MPTSATPFAITAPTLFDGEQFLSDHCVIVRGDTVEQILPAGNCPAGERQAHNAGADGT